MFGSSRLKVSGYRSQPVSNRGSMYFPSDYNVSSTSELSDFDRQFKALMDRTEKFTNRVEKLQDTATYIRKGFKKLTTTVTGMRNRTDTLDAAYDHIDRRLDDRGDPPSTEEEWRRLVDRGRLIQKCVELVR